MVDLAAEERAGLGLTCLDRLDPYALASEHGVRVYPIDQLADCSEEAVAHFRGRRRAVWSAALVPVGSARLILENTAHARVRRRASIAHELGHFLLEHPFDPLTEDGCRRFDATKERQATFLAGELLIPYRAALKAAFAGKTNEQVAKEYGVSVRFAQMCMSGARVHARRALAKQAGFVDG